MELVLLLLFILILIIVPKQQGRPTVVQRRLTSDMYHGLHKGQILWAEQDGLQQEPGYVVLCYHPITDKEVYVVNLHLEEV